MSSYPQLFLNAKRAKYFDGRHPWVLDRSVVEPTIPIEPGSTIELLNPNGSWIGRGVYNPFSRIRVRLYQWDSNTEFDDAWISAKLDQSVKLREHWQSGQECLDAVRMVNSEGDGLSGLIVDRFGDYLVVQITALAMWARRDTIATWLADRFSAKGIYVGIESHTAKQEGLEEEQVALSGWRVGEAPAEAIELSEHGVRFRVSLEHGQKTGCYLDQRANRVEAAKWLHPGRLLDVCCYQGGFSLAACYAEKVVSGLCVDSSAKALEIARQNAVANEVSQLEFVQADCFDHLKLLEQEREQFDNVILDPPRMAATHGQISSALRAYHRLNLSAVNVLRPGGILVTCSCSGRVSREEFWGMLASVAKRTRRPIQVLESRGADSDHPIDVNCPESAYLKCFICRVG